MAWLVTQFKNDHGVDLSADKMAAQRLKEAAEKAKIELSTVPETEINLPFITATADGPLHLQYKLTRSEFQKITEKLLARVENPVKSAVKDAGISMDDIDHIVMVGGSTRMPAVQELVQRLTGKEPHKGVNPDEVVAAGAAIQAGVLKGDVKDILLLDVTPLTLGIETKGGVLTKMIERNTTIPTRKSETFTTAEANQPEVEIHVLQGERAMAQDNKSLGKFRLTGIPPAPMGVPQIEVTFDIDANGIVNVTAKDRATNKEQAMTITGGTALANDEIDKMVKDAEAYAEEDRKRREAVETHNRADQLVHQTEKVLSEQGESLNDEEKSGIDTALGELKTLLGDENVEADALQAKMDALVEASQNAFTRVYQEAAAAESDEGMPGESAGESDDDDDIVEAEIIDEGDE
jgi:molecular chaperone DnaK